MVTFLSTVVYAAVLFYGWWMTGKRWRVTRTASVFGIGLGYSFFYISQMPPSWIIATTTVKLCHAWPVVLKFEMSIQICVPAWDSEWLWLEWILQFKEETNIEYYGIFRSGLSPTFLLKFNYRLGTGFSMLIQLFCKKCMIARNIIKVSNCCCPIITF